VRQRAHQRHRAHQGGGGSPFGWRFASEGGPAPAGKEANRRDAGKDEAGGRGRALHRAGGPIAHDPEVLFPTSTCCQVKRPCTLVSSRAEGNFGRSVPVVIVRSRNRRGSIAYFRTL